MKNKLLYLLAFVSGAAVGIVATKKYFDEKYKRIADEEIESVKEVFSKENKKEENNIIEKSEKYNEKEPEEELEQDKNEYNAVLEKLDYSRNKEAVNIKPRVISPDEFGDIEEYEKYTLTYYADQVLTDDNDDVIYDIDGTVGEDSLETFGEYEDDAVHVINENLKCYYEILLDQREYSAVRENKHYI